MGALVACVTRSLDRQDRWGDNSYAVLNFLGVKVFPSSSSGGQRFFLGETCSEEYNSDIWANFGDL